MNILERLEAGILTDDPGATLEVARQLAIDLPENSVIGLSGDLGAGKTTFVKGLAAAWGIEGNITSPTYTIFTLYSGGQRQLAHMDAYRLDGAASVETLMLEDFLQPPFSLVVEWPEKIADWLPTDTLLLRLEMLPGSHQRRIQRIDSLRG